MNTRATRSIPEIFIPKQRSKPRARAKSGATTLAMAAAAEQQRDRELGQLDTLMRTNTCPWL